MKRRVGFIFLVLFLIGFVNAADYYVTSSGSGSTCSQSAPCSFSTAQSSANAGDTIYFRNTDTWTASGGSQFISAKGGVIYDGQTWGTGTRATIRATGSFSQAIIMINQDHPTYETVVRGFNVDGNNQQTSGVNINWPSSNNLLGTTKRIEDCIIHDITQGAEATYGIKLGAIGGDEVHNSEIINNVVYNTPRTGINVYLAIDCPTCIAYNTLIRGNEVYNTGGVGAGHGIMLKNYGIDTVVEYNYVHNTNAHCIEIEDQGAPGPKDAIVRYNLLRDCGAGGVTFFNSGDKSADIYGNLIFNSARSGIIFQSLGGANIAARIYNNVLYHNIETSSDSAEILIASANYNPLEVKNNLIIPNSGKSAISGSSYVTSQSNNLLTNPNFKNTNNLPTGFVGTYGVDLRPNNDGLSIESGSAIDGGVNLGGEYASSINSVSRPQGSGWDIGAYEYISGTSTYECSDSIDNDGDGNTDYPNDSGCSSTTDNDETNCNDGVCEGGETTASCSSDCPSASPEHIAHWGFSEGTGSITHDSFGFDSACTLVNNPTWTTGISGQGILFDGVDDYLDCSSDGSLDITGEITLAAWVYPTGTGDSNYPRIIDKSSGTSEISSGYKLYSDSSQNYAIRGSAGGSSHISTGSIALNQWNFIALVIDGASWKVFINEAWEEWVDSTLPSSASNNFYLGNSPVGTRHFQGIIDEVNVWNFALTDSEINSLYHEFDSASSCSSGADSTGDSVVSIGELLNFISEWKAGHVTIGNLLSGIGEWKNGC